jgi:hypothetical protein
VKTECISAIIYFERFSCSDDIFANYIHYITKFFGCHNAAYAMTRSVEISLLEMMGEEDLPEEIEAKLHLLE